jgi:hypothetical protein
MEHSSNDAAIMYPTSHSFPTLSPFEDLSIDDAVGARYLYQQPAADLSPDSPMGNKIMLLENKSPDFDIAYDIFVSHDKHMKLNLGSGSIKPSEITYWIEKKDTFNEPRRYRVRVQCDGQSFSSDGIAPQQQVSFFYYLSRKRGNLYHYDQWGDYGEP